MNRNGRRLLKNKHGLTPKMLDDMYDKVRAETRRDAYNNAFAGMLLALNQLHGFGYKRIRAVAVKTLQNINGTTCATELIEAARLLPGLMWKNRFWMMNWAWRLNYEQSKKTGKEVCELSF